MGQDCLHADFHHTCGINDWSDLISHLIDSDYRNWKLLVTFALNYLHLGESEYYRFSMFSMYKYRPLDPIKSTLYLKIWFWIISTNFRGSTYIVVFSSSSFFRKNFAGQNRFWNLIPRALMVFSVNVQCNIVP